MPTKNDAAAFRAMHAPGKILLLPNGWDAASARVAEDAGAAAIATSSAALSWAHGYADGEAIPPSVLLAAVGEIARVISVPLSVDAEAGLKASADDVAELVLRLVTAGASGINLEDGTAPPDVLAAKIRAIRAAVKSHGADVFINARADVYLRKLVDADAMRAETIARGRLYAEAGADGFFAPGVTTPDDISAIAAAVALPLNVLVFPGLPPVAEVKAAGARRISAGSGTARAAFGVFRKSAKQFLETGTYEVMNAGAEGLPNMNALFAGR